MPVYITPDGRYIYAIETPNQGDGNSVVYDTWRKAENGGEPLPVWDRWGYEAGLGSASGPITPSPAPPGTAGPTPVPTPIPDPGSQPIPAGSMREPIQVTNESDGEISPRIDASRTRVFIAGAKAYVFAGHADGRPRFFSVDIQSGAVERLGPLVGFTGTGEEWYWDAHGWIYLLDGPRLRRVSPLAGGETETVFDISDSHPGCDLWQPHSSEDGTVHSATVRDAAHPLPNGRYPYIETLVVRNGREIPFPAKGTLDESQITPDGGWVVIKETLEDGLSNRIINVVSRETQLLRKPDGALGHSDAGPGYVVGEWSYEDHGECVYWDLRGPLVPERRRFLFQTWNLGHLSIRAGRCLRADETHLSMVSMSSGVQLPLLAHRMTVTDPSRAYDFQVQAPLDMTGRAFCYLSNEGRNRFDLFLGVLIP